MSQQAMAVSSKSKEKSSVCSQTKEADSSVSSQSKEDASSVSSQPKEDDAVSSQPKEVDDSSVSSQPKEANNSSVPSQPKEEDASSVCSQPKEDDDASVSSQPNGDDSSEVTPLERHVAFFDRNGDGLIYPWETYQGFRAIGAGRLVSAFAALSINIGLSHQTRPGKRFSPLFPIEWKNSELALHGSDTGVYDKNGRFVESKFEEMFNKHAQTHQDALTYKEIKQLLKANRDPLDLIGWISAYGEWKLMHQLFKDKDGLLQKDKVRGVYDGTLFEQIQNKNGSSSSSSCDNKND